MFEYADQEKVNLVITKEGMYPEFTIDGVEYTAERRYHNVGQFPVAAVVCHRKDREIKGEGVEEPRKVFQWLLHRWGGMVIVLLVYSVLVFPLLWADGMTWEAILIFVSLLAVVVSMTYRDFILHFNDKTKK